MASGVQVDRASMVKIARQHGEAGKPVPAWVKADPEFLAAYELGQGRGPVPFHPPRQPKKKPPAKPPAAKKPADTRPAGKPRRPYFARAFSPTAAAGRVAGAGPVQAVHRAGDGGGLLLALVIYPLFLATVKYGAQGPAVWFRAKWLNKTTDVGTGAAPPRLSHAPIHATKPAGGIGRSAA